MTHLNPSLEHVTAVQARYSNALMQKPHVVGVAVGVSDDNQIPCLVVMVDKLVPQTDLKWQDRIPEQLEGVKVEIRETGAFFAQDFTAG
jgi:hypothetical protein